jgi:pyruvate dehydrogenase (quinone)
MMIGCDTLLMIGSSFPYSEFLPEEGRRAACRSTSTPHAEHPLSDGGQPDRRQRRDAARVAAAAQRKKDRSWREEIEKDVADWWKVLESRAMNERQSDQPAARVLGAVAAPAGRTASSWRLRVGGQLVARDLKIRRGMMASLSGTLATMGPAVPYAIAAKFAIPSRLVVAMVGDGAMQMNGMNELITIAKYWKEWSNPRLVVLCSTTAT